MGDSDSLVEADRNIRVLIADTHPMGAQLLADALRRSHRFGTVLAANRAADVATMLADQSLDVALISADFEGEAGRGFKLAQEVQTASTETKVVMLLDIPDRDSVVQAFRAGCHGVFCRARSVKELPKCIACVHAGQIWANSQELAFVLAALREPQPLRVVDSTVVPLLTKREMAVVKCVAEGLTNRETAAQLSLSEHTVKNYMFRIFDKLGVSSRVELVLYVASQLQSEPSLNCSEPSFDVFSNEQTRVGAL
jgi:two-component system nitrate/nitrite response regulator NarL